MLRLSHIRMFAMRHLRDRTVYTACLVLRRLDHNRERLAKAVSLPFCPLRITREAVRAARMGGAGVRFC